MNGLNNNTRYIAVNDDLKNLRFNVTEDMNNAFIEALLIKEMLKNETQTKKERELLEKQLEALKEYFVSEFKKNNVEERLMYHKYMS